MEEYVNVKAGDEILCVPLSVVNSWSPSQWLWANQPRQSSYSDKLEARAKIAGRLWRAHKGYDFQPLNVLPKRYINKFQFWLRTELTALRLI